MENLDELKLRIIHKLIATEDIEILKKMDEFMSEYDLETDNNVNGSKSAYHSKIQLTEQQKLMLIEAENDIKEGRFYTDDEVRKMTEEWLK